MIFEERPFGIKLTNPGNIDWYYSSGLTAYNSYEDVFDTIPAAIRLGKTVAVKTGNTLIEYWFASGVTDNDLVAKSPNIDLSGYQLAGNYVSASTLANYYTSTESDSTFQPLGDYVVPSDLSAYQLTSQKNFANGYAGLNSSGLLPFSLFPDRLLGNVVYKGTYNGSTITSADSTLNGQPLPTASSANTGYYLISTSDYTYSGLTFETGDWIISNGDAGWAKIDNSDAVTSVFGRNGNVVANQTDYAGFYVNKTGDTIDGLLNVQNFLPTSNNTYDIGSSSFNFSNLYSNTLNSNIIKTTSGGAIRFFHSTSVEKLRLFTGSGNLLFQNGGPFTDGGYGLDIQNLSTNGYFRAGTNSFVITSGGTVGIGNTTPGAATHIQSSATTQLRLAYSDALFSTLNTDSNGNFLIRANSSGGQIHIGSSVMSNASSILNVNGNICLEASSVLQRQNTASTNFGFVNNQGSQIRFRSSGTQAILIDSGNVQIGTGTPSYQLDVNGTARIVGDLLVQSGTINAAAGTTTVPALKFTSGSTLSTPQNGAFEYDGTNLYFTVGGVRRTVNLT